MCFGNTVRTRGRIGNGASSLDTLSPLRDELYVVHMTQLIPKPYTLKPFCDEFYVVHVLGQYTCTCVCIYVYIYIYMYIYIYTHTYIDEFYVEHVLGH